MVELRRGNDLDLDEVIDLYVESTLGERRPVCDRERMGQMLANANLVITAWDAHTLVGIARSVSDFAYSTYLADLAVRRSHQRQGIGVQLIDATQRAGGRAKIILLASPAATDYYPHIGMRSHDSAWVLPADESVRTA